MPPRTVAFEEEEVCAHIPKLDTFSPSGPTQALLAASRSARLAIRLLPDSVHILTPGAVRRGSGRRRKPWEGKKFRIDVDQMPLTGLDVHHAER